MMKNLLVLCTGNSCRSQMMEGFLRKYAKGTLNIYSAGIEAHGLNPLVVQVMQEIGLDLSGHTSNTLDEFAHVTFDIVLTVCDNAQENCPVYPAAKMFHQSFKDPAKTQGSPEEMLEIFRQVRNEIDVYAQNFISQLV